MHESMPALWDFISGAGVMPLHPDRQTQAFTAAREVGKSGPAAQAQAERSGPPASHRPGRAWVPRTAESPTGALPQPTWTSAAPSPGCGATCPVGLGKAPAHPPSRDVALVPQAASARSRGQGTECSSLKVRVRPGRKEPPKPRNGPGRRPTASTGAAGGGADDPPASVVHRQPRPRQDIAGLPTPVTPAPEAQQPGWGVPSTLCRAGKGVGLGPRVPGV